MKGIYGIFPSVCLSLVGRRAETGRRLVSCRMYLVIVLLLFPQARANPVNTYNGFDACGENGWICEKIFPGSEITFDCSLSRSRNARLWIWTARLPSRIKKMTAQNCDHLELHVDCTRSFRDTKIEQFRLINIQELTLLKPSDTYEYLHDNAPVPHLPPYFHMENIGRVSFYKGLFKGPQKSCSYNSGVMKKMVMKNVHVENVEQGSFESDLDEISWSNVTFENIEHDAINITAKRLFILGSYISEIQTKAFAFKGDNVTLRWNHFSVIGPNSLNVYSYNFDFTENKVKDIMRWGMSVQSSHVYFMNNIIGELAKEALGAISPAYYITADPLTAFTTTYTFTGNEILFMNRFSLHPDWKSYGAHTCSKITVDSNKFNCNCENLFWMRTYTQGAGGDNAGFYQLILNTTHHCNTSSNCTLSAVIPYVCQNESSVALQCTGLNEKETFDEVNFNATQAYNIGSGLEGDLASEVDDTLKWSGEYSEKGNSEMILDKSYYTDKLLGEATGLGSYLWAVIIAAVIIKSVCLLSVLFWYVKRKKRYAAIEIYKYDKTNDSDNLITHTRLDPPNECENLSFHE